MPKRIRLRELTTEEKAEIQLRALFEISISHTIPHITSIVKPVFQGTSCMLR